MEFDWNKSTFIHDKAPCRSGGQVDHVSESLMRSTIHDLANQLSGIRGILELSDPMQPLSQRDRARLDAILTDGMTTLERARFLSMGTLPDAILESGPDWRRKLTEELEPLAVVFRCKFAVVYEGEATHDRWPGDLLRGYVLALTRQILPYVQGSSVGILCGADHKEWRLRWNPASNVPESLRPELEARPRDISARWALRVGGSLGADLASEDGVLTARIPRF
jgi:hypothetical protein